MRSFIKSVFYFLIFSFTTTVLSAQSKMTKVKGGSFKPLYGIDSSLVMVKSFLMDVYPVSNKDYLAFLEDHPEWRKSRVKGIFAEDNYLKDWNGDTDFSQHLLPNSPITYVSWFAAKKYCEYRGERLPTLDEWEYAAMADETSPDARKKGSYNQYILSWYEKPSKDNPIIGSTFKNYWGIYDMHGLVWEWTMDFNSVLIAGESRNNSSKDANLFCGSAAIGASDLKNYAAFMRYAVRGSLKANYCMKNLGFRCVKDINYP